MIAGAAACHQRVAQASWQCLASRVLPRAAFLRLIVGHVTYTAGRTRPPRSLGGARTLLGSYPCASDWLIPWSEFGVNAGRRAFMDAADLMAVALLAEPARRRLYLYLRERGEPVGREEAARHAGVKVRLAAFHLDRMADAGLLEVEYRRL